MFNRNVMNLLLKSTILSTLFSFIVITLTVYHHFQIKNLLQKLENRSA
ncbi:MULTISPECIES: hypothetical protein [Bacillaceae]|nr:MULTISPECIES: hypothetical protein [Bacillaceae]UGB29378.1 hypothetical protein LPC09_16680 [Metabacillus sp. B2-18]